MNRTKYILLKIVSILLLIGVIYFGLGLLATIVMIIMEATMQVMSSELGEDYPTWILYVSGVVFAIFVGGLGMGCGIGYYQLKKYIKNAS